MTDDQGYGDLGAHGNDAIDTPNLDAFARESLEMTRFYVEPVCSPTRSSLLTGRYHMRTGVYATSRGGARIFGDEVTMADLLAEGGYRTGVFGKWHVGDNYPSRPMDKGFQETFFHQSGGIGQPPDYGATYFKPTVWHNGQREVHDRYCTDLFFDGAIDFIGANRGRPFFAYIPTNAPHTPLNVPESYAKPFLEAGLPEKTANLYGMLKNLDENWGRLVTALDEQGLAENTILIFMTDNGPQGRRYNAGLRGSKGNVYEGGIRVPFYVRWPGHTTAGVATDRLGAHIDLLPTFVSAAGLEVPGDLTIDGVDLTPLWGGDIAPGDWPDRTIVIQMIKRIIQNRYQNTAVITQRYKLVSSPNNNYDPDFEKNFDKSTVELYDIPEDPGESKDISDQHPEAVDSLLEYYDGWYDDIERTRGFAIAPIHVGTPHENPTHLCWYQDAHNLTGTSEAEGWVVEVTRAGRYRVTIDWPEHEGGALLVNWQGEESRFPLTPNQYSAELDLQTGTGLLDVGFAGKDGERVVLHWEDKTKGDVFVELLDNTDG